MNELEIQIQKYFDEIKNIWEELELENRIIPFCTPLKLNPKFLVIGLNHSAFSRNVEEANQIAKEFSENIPKVNTYVEHHHSFAKGLRAVIEKVHNKFNDLDKKPSDEWVGTNRIAIQTGSEGADYVMNQDKYQQCQKKMDKVLLSLISYIKPRNIILAGNDACDGFYYPSSKEPGSKKQPMQKKELKKVILDKDTQETTNIIPLWHFSRNYFNAKNTERLEDAIKEGFCAY